MYNNSSVISIDLSGNFLTSLAPSNPKKSTLRKNASRKASAAEAAQTPADSDRPEIAGTRSKLGFVHFTQALTVQAPDSRRGLVRVELSDNDLSCCAVSLHQLLDFHKESLRVVSLGNCRVSLFEIVIERNNQRTVPYLD